MSRAEALSRVLRVTRAEALSRVLQREQRGGRPRSRSREETESAAAARRTEEKGRSLRTAGLGAGVTPSDGDYESDAIPPSGCRAVGRGCSFTEQRSKADGQTVLSPKLKKLSSAVS